jgi:hypothetical protein
MNHLLLQKPLITKIYNNNNYNYQYIINDNMYELDQQSYIIIICDILDDKFNYIKSNLDDIEQNNNNLKDKLEQQLKQNEHTYKLVKNIILWLIFNFLIGFFIGAYNAIDKNIID